MRSPKDFFRPLALGAPAPLHETPRPPSRVIHFFDPSNDKMVAKLPALAAQADIVVANLEDGIPPDRKQAARDGLEKLAGSADLGPAQLWTRMNSLDSPWARDDLVTLIPRIGARLDVVMIPKVEGPEDIHFVDRLLAQLEAESRLDRPILVHALLETARGVSRIEEICAASPRLQGVSLGPADLAADRGMKTTRVGGGHPDYLVRADPPAAAADSGDGDAPASAEIARATYQQDLWHYTLARMVDACVAHDVLPFSGPFGDISDPLGCEDHFRNAFLLGCVGGWSLHPSQIEIARRVFSPDPAEVRWAQRVIQAMGDGTGTVMVEGKMQDEATYKQCRTMVDLARAISERDPELGAVYGFDET